MVATAIQEKSPYLTNITNGHTPRKITWEEFEKKYLSREDNFKYEWVDGLVEKTPRTMDQKQQFLYANLEDFLTDLKRQGKAQGRFLSEVDTFFLNRKHRRPDIAYFTDIQQKLMAQDINQVPSFVIEIISSRDQINPVHEKMQNYRDANVAIVWHIFPRLQEVHVYNNLSMNICKGDMMCSAESVIPNFKISANDIFKKP